MMEKINPFQITVLIILFQLGSAIVLGIGRDAGKDSWVAILAGTGIGVLFFFLYTLIYSFGKKSTWKDLLCFSFGKWVGSFLAFLYALYFIYLSARVLGDFAFFIQNEFLTVSSFLVKITMVLAIGYIAYLGIETLGRSGEVLFFITLFILVPIFSFFFISNTMDFRNLRPIREDLNQVMKALFPLIITVPFGELVVFFTLFKYVNDFQTFMKRGWMGVLTSGLLLATVSVLTLGTLSKELMAEFNFPFVKAVQNINIEFLPHLEIIIIIIFMIGGIIKISIFFQGGIEILSTLFHVKNEKKLIIPVQICIFFITILFMKNYMEHITVGLKMVPYYLHLPFQIGIPLCMLVSLFVRKMLTK